MSVDLDPGFDVQNAQQMEFEMWRAIFARDTLSFASFLYVFFALPVGYDEGSTTPGLYTYILQNIPELLSVKTQTFQIFFRKKQFEFRRFTSPNGPPDYMYSSRFNSRRRPFRGWIRISDSDSRLRGPSLSSSRARPIPIHVHQIRDRIHQIRRRLDVRGVVVEDG